MPWSLRKHLTHLQTVTLSCICDVRKGMTKNVVPISDRPPRGALAREAGKMNNALDVGQFPKNWDLGVPTLLVDEDPDI